MTNSIVEHTRKSHIKTGEIYFWTATINKWQHLLEADEYKDVIIQSLEHLSKKGKTDVFAFVLMPNHIHLIWRINENNGKETTQASFLKFTAHEFKKMLKEREASIGSHPPLDVPCFVPPSPWFVSPRTNTHRLGSCPHEPTLSLGSCPHEPTLHNFAITAHNKSYEFWQRDSLAVHLYTKKVAYQKLDYIHNNPLAERWQLAKDPADYKYSSAGFYERGVNDFLFLKDLSDEF